MAFKAVKDYGAVEQVKPGEFAVTQIVEITNAKNEVTRRNLEVRTFVESDRYSGPTKAAISFGTVEDVQALIEVLQEAVEDYEPVDRVESAASDTPKLVARKPKAGAAKAAKARAAKRPARRAS